jgi:catechol 2,3-dioxygenase-like lactoylglutathione lyase family enzyme
MNPFGHVDLRVTSFEENLPFYEKLLPELGFTRTFHSARWRVFAATGELPSAAYFAITEAPDHELNQNMIGFWAESPQEVDHIADLVRESGGKITSGPQYYPISPSYYAVYFEDPCGNPFEVTYRKE